MFDAATTTTPLQRVRGRAMARLSGGRLRDLHQSGSAKCLLPRVFGRAPEVVFLNTAGGVTGGDHLEYSLRIEDGAALGTTQTAERAYRATGAPGRVETRLSVGPGATLHWVPQELILFDGAALDRRLSVEMAEDAELILLETLVLGRAAMGERVQNLRLTDRRDVMRGGKRAMIEAIRLTDADLTSASPAGLNGATATASLTLIAPDAEDRLARLRTALPRDIRAAASAWDGRLTARFLAPRAYPLRKAVARAVECITNAPLPRVWQI
ncbi:urease accessory protein UreD [Gymnodinialimonas sp. 2305UL16-5]|uniref:urease accessory protein UreD n=1 Tax=Gymnodinialimonas mytili TaxID=3126503 RepID=UPI0030B00D1E